MTQIVKALVVGVALMCACARTVPPGQSSAALYRDLQRLVTLTDAAGWDIDRVEVEGMLADALMSVCRVEPEHRAALMKWIAGRVDALGGDVKAQYAARGNKLGRVEQLLEITRIRSLLVAALAAADEDCPGSTARSRFAAARSQMTAGSFRSAVAARESSRARTASWTSTSAGPGGSCSGAPGAIGGAR